MEIKLILCGDVMTGRGIDQIFPYSCPPKIHERFMTSALGYVQLAEVKSGPFNYPVDYAYIWGDVLAEFDRIRPDARIINLETAITLHEEYTPKGINYRMHPQNISCLLKAKFDCCNLANNHVLDWKEEGLIETLDTLCAANIKYTGAGRTLQEAQNPAVINLHQGRILIFGFGMESSGIPPEWAASQNNSGINFLRDLSKQSVRSIRKLVKSKKRPKDIAIASIHWGPNWGYRISQQEILFAHQLIDEAEIDVIHGHSSHHPKAIEVYRDKLILYGCGDFLNDYEGISGYEEFRADLSLMYFATLHSSSGKLLHLELLPAQMKQFQLRKSSFYDSIWLQDTLNRECSPFGTQLEVSQYPSKKRNILLVKWS